MLLTLIFSILIFICIYSAIFNKDIKNTQVTNSTVSLNDKRHNFMKKFPIWVLILALILEIVLVNANKSQSPDFLMTPLDYVTQYVVLCGLLLIIRAIILFIISTLNKN